MNVISALNYVLGIGVVFVVGWAAMPSLFADNLRPGVWLGPYNLGGRPVAQLPQWLEYVSGQYATQEITVLLRGEQRTYPLPNLGITLDQVATAALLERVRHAPSIAPTVVAPQFAISKSQQHMKIIEDLAHTLSPPQDASLSFTPSGALVVTPSSSGEGVDTQSLQEELAWRARSNRWERPIELAIVQQAPEVHEGEVAHAQAAAEQLLASGLTLTWEEQEWHLSPWRVRSLLRFLPEKDVSSRDNYVLGVEFDEAAFGDYLTHTIEPAINTQPVDARFTVESIDGEPVRVTQFAVGERGQLLDRAATIEVLQQAVQQGVATVPLTVSITEPAVTDIADARALGVTTLLAAGTSDFKGSSASRAHNIAVGTSRYHGLLVPPGEEFSFNEFLGPVTGSAGFKPELVIKKNATVPEFGGGLCQVSTTAFRAAIHSGMDITERRNHSYAVRYYGTPGFDATIYPGHTDFRFINNTPGYLLIQARVEGTEVTFEFWGTDDGRTVEVVGPNPYGRQPNGAVKATLQQTVHRDGEVIIDDEFYSRYKSPDLYPRTEEGAPAPSPAPPPTST